ncbi:MAG TPA: DUF2075 domain-containing protein [Gammaproteobacteria bacterium]|nr:DUF2075 domain-containing protein [Gammaproteobacteria bacterium]
MMDLSICYRTLGFKHSPFTITPDTELFFPSKNHVIALSHMQYSLTSGGFTLITGEVGLGKTLLCRELLRKCDKNIRTAYIFNPLQTINDLLRAIHFDLTGKKPQARTTAQLHDAIYKALLIIASRGERAAIIIDEAHRLNPELLEALRLISNIETEKEKLLSLILVGQPELSKILSSVEMRPLAQRISVRYVLQPLNFKATRQYIRHRLKLCSIKQDDFYFSTSALLLAYWYSRGAPRRINQICDRALLAAFANERHFVSMFTLRKAAREVLY